VRLILPTLLIIKALSSECDGVTFISISNIAHEVVSNLSLLFTMLGVSNNNTLITIVLGNVGSSAEHQTYAGTGPATIKGYKLLHLHIRTGTCCHLQAEPVVAYLANIKRKENKSKARSLCGEGRLQQRIVSVNACHVPSLFPLTRLALAGPTTAIVPRHCC
jgi:hypothetical protein